MSRGSVGNPDIGGRTHLPNPKESYPEMTSVHESEERRPVIRVLVVDDHAFVRAMVSQVLSAAAGIEVIGECQDGVGVVDAAESLNADIVLMDVQMPGRSGIDATRDLAAVCPLVRVLMLTGAVTTRFVTESATAGARGYLVKSGDPQLLVSAVRTVASGGSVWP